VRGKRVGPSGPRSLARRPADEVVWMTRVAQLSRDDHMILEAAMSLQGRGGVFWPEP